MDLDFTEVREAREIGELVLNGHVDLVLRRGPAPALVIRGSSAKALTQVRTEFKGRRLEVTGEGNTISSNGGSINMVNYTPGAVQVGHVSGSMQVFHGTVGSVVTGDIVHHDGQQRRGNEDTLDAVLVELTLPRVEVLRVHGSCEVELDDLRQARLAVKFEGSGRIEATGKVDSLEVDVSGSGSLRMRDLIAKAAAIDVSGAGQVRATAQDRVRASVSGAGQIKIYGNPPNRTSDVSGMGRIKFKD